MAKTTFTAEQMETMFQIVNIDRWTFRAALLEIGPVKADDPVERERWNSCFEERGVVTYGFCHRVTEALHRLNRIPDGFEARRVRLPPGSSHYFLLRIGAEAGPAGRYSPEDVIDLTADQFIDGCEYAGSTGVCFPNRSLVAARIMSALGDRPPQNDPGL
jgi:hypothetical protein